MAIGNARGSPLVNGHDLVTYDFSEPSNHQSVPQREPEPNAVYASQYRGPTAEEIDETLVYGTADSTPFSQQGGPGPYTTSFSTQREWVPVFTGDNHADIDLGMNIMSPSFLGWPESGQLPTNQDDSAMEIMQNDFDPFSAWQGMSADNVADIEGFQDIGMSQSALNPSGGSNSSCESAIATHTMSGPLNASLQSDYALPATASAATQQLKCEWRLQDDQLCGQIFVDRGTMNRHLERDHVGVKQSSYVCRWKGCKRGGRVFPQRQKIYRHIKTHTDHRPCLCSCGYSGRDENSLKQHQRTHTGEKPYLCDRCPKAFSAATALGVHKRIHSGVKPLVCNFPGCTSSFSESSNFTKHKRIHLQ